MFVPKNMEVDDELIEVESVYSHCSGRDIVRHFGCAVFNPVLFSDINGLEEVL